MSRDTWRDTTAVEQCLGIRMARQRILNRPRPPRFTFFVHEQALRLQVHNGAVTSEQLLQAVLLTALPHVTIRVVPCSAGHRGTYCRMIADVVLGEAESREFIAALAHEHGADNPTRDAGIYELEEELL